jgi:hypothetical protein
MNLQKVTIDLLSPVAGMLPLVVFFVCSCFFSYHVAFAATSMTFVTYFIVKIRWLKDEFAYTAVLSCMVFLLVVLCSVLPLFNRIYTLYPAVMPELGLVLIFYAFMRIQAYFRTKTIHGISSQVQEMLLLRFDSNLYVIKIWIFLVLVHLCMVVIYRLFPEQFHSPGADRLIYYYMLFLLIAVHGIYEWVRWRFLRRQILKEEWLPIVDESGAVHGKIALSIGLTENKYLHPVIRIALIHKGMLFLKPKLKSQSFDYPFEWYLRFEESLNDGVKAAFARNGGSEDLPARFLFRYIHKETNRLIYLYVCTLTDENLSTALLPENGKWWTNKQIDENLGKGLFSPYFEDEYAILNTTLLGNSVIFI